MEQNLFRVGGVYKNQRGDTVKLSAINYEPHEQSLAEEHPGHTFALADRVDDTWGCGYVSLSNGRPCSSLSIEVCLWHLIPGELVNINGEWVEPTFYATLDREPEKASTWRCPDCLGLGCATCEDTGELPAANTTERTRPPLTWAESKAVDPFDGFAVTGESASQPSASHPLQRMTGGSHLLGVGL